MTQSTRFKRRSGAAVVGVLCLATTLINTAPATAADSVTSSTTASLALAAVAQSWPVAGHDLFNTRNNPDETVLSVTNVGRMKEKWRRDFTSSLTSTPAVVDGVAYLPDQSGNMWAINAATGTVKWTRTIASYTGVSGDLSRATPAVANGRVIFGDQPYNGPHAGSHLVAVNAATGAELWDTIVDWDQSTKITGAPVIDGDVVYLGISSSDSGRTDCCHTRGSVVAVNATNGHFLWQTYMAPMGYTGAAVWGSAPVVDHSTGLLYVGTGNNYTVPPGVCTTPQQAGCTSPAANDYVDSLVALRLTTGKVAWALRTLNGDATTNFCTSTVTCGPDFDFGSAPNRFSATVNGQLRQLVGIGQKSGIYWVVDAFTGSLLWQTRVGPGGRGGGIQWGSATDGKRIYVSIVNSTKATWTLQPSGVKTTGGAFSALDPATGRILWQTADPQSVGDFGYVSSANGVVYVGSGAGSGNSMYALNAATGQILWSFWPGGSVMGGAAILNGTVYWGSGYYTKTCPPSRPVCGTTYRLHAFGL